jgi:hypothetical protein
MNNSSVEFNHQIIESLFIEIIGSSWLTDVLNFYPFTIFGILGLTLNLLAFAILANKREFHMSMYTYLRVYTVQNSIMCLISTFNFLCTSYRLFSFVNSYTAQLFAQFIYIPIANFCYFYNGVLEILILLDRISIMNLRVKQCIKLSPAKICLIAGLACFIIDLPYYFTYEPGAKTILLSGNTTFTAWYLGTTSFATSQPGTVIVFVVAAVRDILVMLILVVLNVTSFILLSRYFKQKRQSISGSCPGRAGSISTQDRAAAEGHVSRAEKRAVIMVTLMCVMSVASHVSILIATVYSFFYLNLTLTHLSLNCNLILVLRCFIDFFLFYAFNTNFKRVCHEYLGFSR